MNLADILTPDTFAVNLSVKNKEQLFSTIGTLACKHPALQNFSPETVAKALLEREELATTSLGGGVAMPHCRISGISSFVTGLVTTKKKLDFNAIDDKKVSIFPFVIGPEENPKEHLKILSGVARLLRNPETRKAISAADSSAALFSLIKQVAELPSAKPSKPLHGTGLKMIHVFICNEELFNDVLQVFASGEFVGALVLQSHESTEYLSSMPVFAGLWNTDLNTFSRIIVAVVKESLLNQTIRNIEYVCGDLHAQTEVMVTVSDLHHVLGSLNY